MYKIRLAEHEVILLEKHSVELTLTHILDQNIWYAKYIGVEIEFCILNDISTDDDFWTSFYEKNPKVGDDIIGSLYLVGSKQSGSLRWEVNNASLCITD